MAAQRYKIKITTTSGLEPIRAPVQTGEVSWMKEPHRERSSDPL